MADDAVEIGTLAELAVALRGFARERDWEKFHTPKNLALSVTIEAAEVAEIFQWLTPEQSQELSQERRAALADEIGDVLIYLVMLADRCGVDPLEAAWSKLARNRTRFPAKDSTRKIH